jgi:hypothetical protein
VQPVQPPADRDSVGSRFAEALPAEEPASGSPSATAPGKLPNQEVHASGLGNSHAPQGEPGALDRGPEDGRAIGGEGPDGPVASTDRHAADAEEADPEEGAAGGSPGAARNALDDLLDDPVDYRQALAAEEAGQDPRDGVSDPAGADQAGADPILAYLEGTSVTVDFAELRAALSDHDGGAASHPRGASWPGPWGGDSDDGFADDDSANGAAGADGVWAHGPPDPGPGHHDGPAGTPGFGSLPDDALGSDADHAGFPDR